MRVRVDEEWLGATKPGGRFGMGVWDNSTYPVSRSLQSSTVRPQQSNPVPIVDEVSSRTITFVLSSDFPTDEEIRAKYVDQAVVAWMMMKRDLELVSQINMDRFNALKNVVQAT
ncbi:hypothetical protein RND81_05G146100 [Saponaria officinalis]|uniref:Uncharacterized protein n=1 Tax=Saponaria officinalis TaxID=3572 RepID=A0AAW1L0Z2_SAPOF